MNKLTNKELEIIKLFIAESFDCCGAFDDLGENMSYMNAQDLVELTDYNAQEIGGIMSALEAKGLIVDTGDSARRLRINDFIANERICRDYHPELAKFIDTYGDEPAEAEPEAAPETMTYGQVNAARRAAEDAEEEANSWMNLAKMSCGHPDAGVYEQRIKEYQTAAERAIKARLEWLNVRNDFESGK